MVKKILFIHLFIYLSCSPLKNEFNKERFKISRFTIKPSENLDLYKIIDTSSIYILTNIYNDGNLKINIPQGLKFYKNGRVGNFRDLDLKLRKPLNPKKAEMGFYKYKKKHQLRELVFKI